MKDAIRSSAWRLFRTHGFNKTTYAMIAEDAGVGRNLVQHYFPKKEELAIGFLKLLSDTTSSVGGLGEGMAKRDKRAIALFNAAYFEFFLLPGSYRTFLLDVLGDLNISERILAFDAFEMIRLLSFEGTPQNKEKYLNLSLLHFGGFYTYAHYRLKHNIPLDMALEATRAISHVLGWGDDAESLITDSMRAEIKAQTARVASAIKTYIHHDSTDVESRDD